MPSMEAMAIVAFSGLLLSLSPGPSMVYVLSRTLAQGWQAGFASAVGLALGGVCLAVAAAVGLASLLHASDMAYQVIRYAGAIYLVYLGGRSVLESTSNGRADAHASAAPVRHSRARLVLQGVIVEIFNPKTILFFLAFVPQFVDTGRGDVVAQMLVLGALVPLTAVPSDLVVSLTGGALVERLKRSSRLGIALEVAGGLLLVGIGVHLFVTS